MIYPYDERDDLRSLVNESFRQFTAFVDEMLALATRHSSTSTSG